MHLARLANQGGAAGEIEAIAAVADWIPRPKGLGLKVLLAELARAGVSIKPSSFDAIAVASEVNFQSPESTRLALENMVFIEIKASNQERVKPGFEGFFFALTESEIAAADQLGSRHRVALFNRLSGELLLTSVPEILHRSKSMTWQLSVQL
ncbi:hypothetical protein CLG96_05940 [Sphingomonas oleivorans]|uniref:Protein NO VEIN C-terminal domain-containing protein n=1 Tax=Sphingomonas oleivorans TaxID=1735121 RepID=A0A2T5FZJ0_9SPHN|nr:hypothetical protein CLG96_05940 [Sphingomonas oleivorans]